MRLKPVRRSSCLCAGAALAVTASALAYDLTSDKCDFEVAVAHLDTQYGWPRDSTYLTYIPNTLHQNFDLFRSNPRYVFSFCGAFRYWIVEQYGRNSPIGSFRQGDWDTLKSYVARGKWALAGSSIDEIDVNIPCAEALCRSFLYGNGYYEDKFGKRSFDIYLPDCFGFSYTLPTIANHFGVRGFSTQKFDLWGGWWPVANAQSIMRWKGPDGSFIYAAMKPSAYSGGYEVNVAAGDSVKALCGMWINYDYYGVGDEGGAPPQDEVQELCNLTGGRKGDVYVFPAASDSLFRVLDRFEKAGSVNVNNLSTYDGELIMRTHGTGGYTSHADVKVRYRGMELAGLGAEPAAVMAEKLAKADYPRAQIWRAWFKGIDHAFHDDINGTSVPAAYYNSWDATVADLDSQITSFNDVRDRSDIAIAGVLNTQVSNASGVPVVVYNPLGLDRRDIVQVAVAFGAPTGFVKVLGPSGAEVPAQIISGAGTASPTILFVAEASSVGYTIYEAQPASAVTGIQTGLTVAPDGSSMSNNDYTVSIDKNGDISQIVDKKAGNRELFAAPHRLELRNDNSSSYPAWEVLEADVMSAPAGYVDENVKLTATEYGPVRVSVCVTRTKGTSTFTQYYRLSADSAGRVVTVDNSVFWNSAGNLLKAGFYFSCSSDSATYGIGVGAINRPTSGTDSRYEVPAQQWATIGNGVFGVAVINRYKYGWSKLSGNNLCNTLIHSPFPNAGSNYAGDTQMTHTFSYGIYGYEGDWKNGVEARAQRFNLPLSAFQTSSHAAVRPFGNSTSFVKLSDPSKAMIMSVKKAEKSDEYVVRVREIAAVSSYDSLIFCYNVVSAKLTNGMEDDDGSVRLAPFGESDNEVGFSIGKYQLKTVKVALGNTFVDGAGLFAARTVKPAMSRRPFEVTFLNAGKRNTVKFQISRDEIIRRVVLTDTKGRILRILYDGPSPLAEPSLLWDSRDARGRIASSGLYVVSVVTGRTQLHALLQCIK